jgi:hypothetical protein
MRTVFAHHNSKSIPYFRDFTSPSKQILLILLILSKKYFMPALKSNIEYNTLQERKSSIVTRQSTIKRSEQIEGGRIMKSQNPLGAPSIHSACHVVAQRAKTDGSHLSLICENPCQFVAENSPLWALRQNKKTQNEPNFSLRLTCVMLFNRITYKRNCQNVNWVRFYERTQFIKEF